MMLGIIWPRPPKKKKKKKKKSWSDSTTALVSSCLSCNNFRPQHLLLFFQVFFFFFFFFFVSRWSRLLAGRKCLTYWLFAPQNVCLFYLRKELLAWLAQIPRLSSLLVDSLPLYSLFLSVCIFFFFFSLDASPKKQCYFFRPTLPLVLSLLLFSHIRSFMNKKD